MAVQKRTQVERSEAMRKRILDSVIQCLATDGYAGTTISRIIETAKVSRGAPIHHFPTKNAMIIAAAEQLVQRTLSQVQEAIIPLNTSSNRLHDLLFILWNNFFTQSEFIAMSELLLNCRRDPELAAVMKPFIDTTYSALGEVAQHYFEPYIGQENIVGEMWTLTRWLLRGLAMDFGLNTDKDHFERYLELWYKILAQNMRVKEQVNLPIAAPNFSQSAS